MKKENIINILTDKFLGNVSGGVSEENRVSAVARVLGSEEPFVNIIFDLKGITPPPQSPPLQALHPLLQVPLPPPTPTTSPTLIPQSPTLQASNAPRQFKEGDFYVYNGQFKRIKDRFGKSEPGIDSVDRLGIDSFDRFGMGGFSSECGLYNGDIVLDRDHLFVYEDHGYYKSLRQII